MRDTLFGISKRSEWYVAYSYAIISDALQLVLVQADLYVGEALLAKLRLQLSLELIELE